MTKSSRPPKRRSGRRRLSSRWVGLSLLAAYLVSLPGCVTLLRYEVLRIPLEDCEIRSNGEFCDEPIDFPPATVEIWALDVNETHTLLYIGDETWVAAGIEGERRVTKEESSSRNSCTTTTTRTLIFNEDGQALTGTFEESFRVEGPESCGDAPFGARARFDLAGATGPVI